MKLNAKNRTNFFYNSLYLLKLVIHFTKMLFHTVSVGNNILDLDPIRERSLEEKSGQNQTKENGF